MVNRIGLIVNPVAGMGGSVGLKGTDGQMYKRAMELGAQPVTPGRTQDLFSYLNHNQEIQWVVAPGKMGADHIQAQGFPFEVLGSTGEETQAEDTKRIAKQMLDAGVGLLVFVSGDGTARDIYDAIGTALPVVAVPSGVKVYSAVFALSPRAAAEMVAAFISGSEFTEEEVLDIDEDAFREDRLDVQLYGYLKVPDARQLLQPHKVASSGSQPEVENKLDIAASVIEDMDAETLYLFGPGTTVKAIVDTLELPKTLLGVDAVYDGQLVGRDLNERGILELLERYEQCKIVVTPIGGNGFVFGRGNKQFTPEVIRRVGKDNLIIVSTANKVYGLPCLRVDTGDLALDQELAGYMQVTIGYHQARVVKVKY